MYYWITILICCILLIFFFVKSQSNHNNELKIFSSKIAQLENLDSKINDAVVLHNIQEINHYDNIVAYADQFEKNTNIFYLNNPILKNSSINPLFKTYLLAVKDKLAAIEQYKSHAAILKNSLAYFFLVSTQLADTIQQHPDIHNISYILSFINETHKISVFHRHNDIKTNQKINTLSNYLQSIDDINVKQLVNHLIVHYDIISKLQPEIIELLSIIHDQKTKKLLDQVFQQYL